MPPRESELPEGTDHIINGALETGNRSAGTDQSGGFIAGSEGQGDDTGGTMADQGNESTGGGTARDQLREGLATLRQDAGDRVRQFAEDGKGRASDVLDEVSRIVEDAADSIEKSLGSQYGGYARSAAHAVSGLSSNLRAREVDELYDEAANFVRRSPMVAIGAAAAVGFALVRLVKAGLPDDAEDGENAGGKATRGQGGRRAKRSGESA